MVKLQHFKNVLVNAANKINKSICSLLVCANALTNVNKYNLKCVYGSADLISKQLF